MNFKDARNLIEQYYEVETLDTTACEIILNKMIDEFNTYFIALKQNGETCYLTDFAKLCEMVDIGENDLENLARNYGLTFDDFYIKKEFNNISDLEDYIAFVDSVVDFIKNH